MRKLTLLIMGILFPLLTIAQKLNTNTTELALDNQDQLPAIDLQKSSNSTFYQIVLIKTNQNGETEWETKIPTYQTGYDRSFTGEDAQGNYLTETNPKPFVSQVKKVADGYILVNNHRVYFPPGTNNIFATIMKLDLDGNFLWSSKQVIPTLGNIVGSAPSSAGNSKYFIGDVAGFEDGKTYICYTGGEDLHPYAQVRILDKSGVSIANYSSISLVSDGASFQIKKFKDKIYWLSKTETILDNGKLNSDNDFSIIDITEGFDPNTTSPIVMHSPTPNTSYIPNNMEMTKEGDFLVSGFKYPVTHKAAKQDPTAFELVLEVNSELKDVDLASNTEEEINTFASIGDNVIENPLFDENQDTSDNFEKIVASFTSTQQLFQDQNLNIGKSFSKSNIALAFNYLAYKTCKRSFSYKENVLKNESKPESQSLQLLSLKTKKDSLQ